MSWAEAKDSARDRIASLNLPRGRLDGCTVTLLLYECDAVCYAATGWGIGWQNMVGRSMYRQLKKRGARVNLHIVKLADVVHWKENASNQKGS